MNIRAYSRKAATPTNPSGIICTGANSKEMCLRSCHGHTPEFFSAIVHMRAMDYKWRAAGKYSFGKAIGTVSTKETGEKRDMFHRHFEITVEGSDIDDVVTLSEIILAGKIAPDADYSADQIKSVPKHAGDLIKELWTIFTRTIRSEFKKSLRVRC